MKQYDIAIIGGGVAGYFAAIKLLEKQLPYSIVIFEKESQSLQKLLTTGSGACNFTHSGSIDDFLNHYGKNGQFLRNAFNTFFVNDIIDFFEENNIKTSCREDGKYFPSSMKAMEIKKLFLKKTEKITTINNCAIAAIKKKDDIFIISTQDIEYSASNVIIATGGKSFPKTGSTGDGYIFAQEFCHTIVNPKPSLASVYCNNHELSELSGNAFPHASITIKNGNKTTTYTGALLITHKGFSGPVIIDNSRNLSNGDTIQIAFVKEKRDVFEKHLLESKQETIQTAIKKYSIPKKMVSFFCDKAGIDSSKKIAEISKKNIIDFVSLLVSYQISISNIESFDSCMCTAGGVSLKEVNPKTFESKLVSGLYFLGEVLDIDGDSGGYNLQAIWSECAIFSDNFY